ncbi:DUF4145 domain-containing protein [Sulfitobacter brevis]|uniref:DUF4145 domain-containing protein n=1 Tax=Sulfitobacter brevis TaxID=74348 RepID=UPI001C4333E5|nr:DUF4145 domain-containing protein [Sulfitobacter brevis]
MNDIVRFENNITLKDRAGRSVPEHLPPSIEQVIKEGNVALANRCYNAAAAMYRLALDLATKMQLPPEGDPNAKIRRSLGFRIDWLLKEGILPKDLEHLASCVREDANDGAHEGNLAQADAEDLHDFCYELMRRLYTEPKRLELAEERRKLRRS